MPSPVPLPSVPAPVGRAFAELPTLSQLAPAINLLIDIALVAFLVYILVAARKGR
ncbi:MAG: hypothetical protein KHY67_00900 [Collinsella intestinalis]|uniref:Uncharacterized protein n=1 Tax=Collinsella intestinalis TaxID=147207 RepID=A0A943BKT7_9ACTN|nr:hypothetical protein [Collinsella intestinalis]